MDETTELLLLSRRDQLSLLRDSYAEKYPENKSASSVILVDHFFTSSSGLMATEDLKPLQSDIIFSLFSEFLEDDSAAVIENKIQKLYDSLSREGRLILDLPNSTRLLKETSFSYFYDDKNPKLKFDLALKGDMIKESVVCISSNHSKKLERHYQAFRKIDLLGAIRKANFILESIYGDYQFSEFNDKLSNRMIFILTKA